MIQPDDPIPEPDESARLRATILELLAHRASRLVNTCRLPDGVHPPDVVVGMFTAAVIDAAMAYAPDQVVAALCRRLSRDSQIRAGVCIDCGKNPAIGDHGIILCEQCLQAERQADREVEQQVALERAQTGRPM